MRQLTIILGCLLLACPPVLAQGSRHSQSQEWRYYGHDPGGMRFSPLDQINTTNVGKLERAWTYRVARGWDSGIEAFETTPLMIDGVLYFTTQTSRAIAVEAETGKELWVFDPLAKATGAKRPHRPIPNRGAAYWEGTSSASCRGQAHKPDRRIYYTALNGRLYSLDANTGLPCPGFGDQGSINLRQGVADNYPEAPYDDTSPPVVYKDLVINGSEVQENPSKGASGDIRAFNARTGRLVWRFHTVPRPGEPGHETWEDDSWVDRSGTNAWSIMSLDDQRGIVYIPLGSPSYDFYGADRKGEGLFGNSLVALDAATGKLIWYHQLVHHDIWDYDLCSPPALITAPRNGREIPAVAQVTKMGFVFVFDRLTGAPLFPIEERPVKASQVPGEATWATQPFPPKSMQLARTSVTLDEVTQVTPESRQWCLDNFRASLPGGIFTPWGLKDMTVEMPGTLGGGNWSGASFDPTLDYLFVNVSEVGAVGFMRKTPEGSPEAYVRSSKWGGYARFWDEKHYPCQQPPWGDLNAIDLKTGELAWKSTLGVVDDLTAKGVPPTGIYNLGGSITTAGGLVFIGGTVDHRFRAFDARTGKQLWVAQLQGNAHSTPITFMGRKTHKQFVVVATGPGGFFDTSTTAPYEVAAYALVPPGSNVIVQGGPQSQARTISTGRGSEPATLPAPADAATQPIPFSHRLHMQNGLECATCHQVSANGSKMQIPRTADCMVCHQSIKTDSPVIQHLAAMEKDHEPVRWTRLYELPGFVFFSHQKHLNAKVACQVCHGPVPERDVLWQEKDISMNACVSCHKLQNAPLNCDRCHDIGH